MFVTWEKLRATLRKQITNTKRLNSIITWNCTFIVQLLILIFFTFTLQSQLALCKLFLHYFLWVYSHCKRTLSYIAYNNKIFIVILIDIGFHRELTNKHKNKNKKKLKRLNEYLKTTKTRKNYEEIFRNI